MPVAGNLRRLGFTGENIPDLPPERPCNGRTDLDWYSDTPEEIAAVKAVCAVECPFQVTCLQWALDRREAWGVWGGLDPEERAKYGAKIGAAKPTTVRHGQRARYQGTKSTPGCRCDLCKRAHASYEHERRLLKVDRERAGLAPASKSCAQCGQQFTPRTGIHRFCSPSCNDAAQKERYMAARRSKRCVVCGRSVAAGRQRYCSQECAKRAGSRQEQARRVVKRQPVAA